MARMMRVDAPERTKEETFKSLFDLFYDRLILFAENLLSVSGEAPDLVQDAFVALWQRMDNFDDQQAVKVFLYLTVRNKCFNILKHDKVVRRYMNEPAPTASEEHITLKLMEAEVLGEVQQYLKQLPEGCRSVIHLSYFEGLRNHEIADRLNVSVNTVKTQKGRGLRLMRDMMKKQPYHFLFLFGKIF
ncbi:MAG TPA: RNA polymerase sigma-70 factor [Chitinophaga sp.]|uniref:RNA polymerase sigma-70 factor n=1 Tax=Chitinophaga sp. TaxID=1869181 RepID=UPI002BCF386C|nr:RNA polymerase sigma-70 factor [Chitinophaga sp.]HVI46360.1 RNA polymerase sigma-70 factor [Chitinophaga sp.]